MSQQSCCQDLIDLIDGSVHSCPAAVAWTGFSASAAASGPLRCGPEVEGPGGETGDLFFGHRRSLL